MVPGAGDDVQALKAGKHVLVEKPMALTTAEGERMLAKVPGEHRRHE